MNKKNEEHEITSEEMMPEQFRRGLSMIRQGAMSAPSNEMREICKYAVGHMFEERLLLEALLAGYEAHERHITKLLSQAERARKDYDQLLRANVRLSAQAQRKAAV